MKFFNLLLFLVFFTQSLLAQIDATTNDGKKVLLNEDGTWEFVKTEVRNDTSAIFTCESLIDVTVDKVTGDATEGMANTLIVSEDGGKTGFGISIFKIRNFLVLGITAVGAGRCIDDDAKMNILFTDGSRLEMTNDAKFNCDSNYTQYLGGSFGRKKEIISLTTKKIEIMRVWTSDGYVEKTFDASQAETFRKSLECLNR